MGASILILLFFYMEDAAPNGVVLALKPLSENLAMAALSLWKMYPGRKSTGATGATFCLSLGFEEP